MNYHRVFIPGGTYFFTVVTFQRQPIFTSPFAIDLLRNPFRYTLARHPFTIVAIVVLPDHLHTIWTLPPNSSDFSVRWRLLKSHFTRHLTKSNADDLPRSRILNKEKGVWQRRFWEHSIRDEKDLFRHIDYIHFNPVKHELVESPLEWEYSSFRSYVQKGWYQQNWGDMINTSNFDSNME